jgi:uncharacterized membrane protein YciS (DUF1049 family)
MIGYLIAYFLGFVTGALLLGMAWLRERRHARELEELLKLSIGQIVSRFR